MLRRSFASARAFSTSASTGIPVASGGYRKKFDPTQILPHEFGHVRVINNTTRDAQQVRVRVFACMQTVWGRGWLEG